MRGGGDAGGGGAVRGFEKLREAARVLEALIGTPSEWFLTVSGAYNSQIIGAAMSYFTGVDS